MKQLKLAVLFSVAPIVGGCSHYPLPQDFSGKTTWDIVRNVRCQARKAVRSALIDELIGVGDAKVTATYTGRSLADALLQEKEEYTSLDIKTVVNPKLRDRLNYYATTQVGYQFTLQLKENNLQGAGVDLLGAFSRRADVINLSGSADRTRDTNRNFTMRDTFINLATGSLSKYCMEEPTVDIIYPITGSLPVYDLVDSYISLNAWGDLYAAKVSSIEGSPSGPAVRQMSDTLTFTTKISSKANATVDFNPIGAGFFASGLGFTNENYRQDIHTVLVTLSTADVVTTKNGTRIRNPSLDDIRSSTNNAIDNANNRNLQQDISSIARSLSNGTALLR